MSWRNLLTFKITKSMSKGASTSTVRSNVSREDTSARCDASKNKIARSQELDGGCTVIVKRSNEYNYAGKPSHSTLVSTCSKRPRRDAYEHISHSRAARGCWIVVAPMI